MTAAQASAQGDVFVRAEWHPVARAADLVPGRRVRTRVLGGELTAWLDAAGAPRAQLARQRADPDMPVAACERYGLVWARPDGASDGAPPPFPEHDDPAWRAVLCGPFGVAVSAPRIIENFLDMAHFPYVHNGVLGVKAHTEVPDYTVRETGTGLVAPDCRFWQPGTDVLAHAGSLVHYEYRVTGAYSAVFAKLPEAEGSNGVAILLAVQPAEEESSIAWMVFCTTNQSAGESHIRANQDRVFLQDKPILENQLPRRLPLDPRAEMPLRCDRLSSAYRRLLSQRGVRFGVIPA